MSAKSTTMPVHCLGLKSYFQRPGDGRCRPRIPARDLVWGVVIGRILRVLSFFRLDWLAHSTVRTELGIKVPFRDDALAYCTERMDPETTRLALAAGLHQAKRDKAFENSRFIGLAIDGTGAGYTYKGPCPLCDPIRDAKGQVHGSLHHFVLISAVGAGLTLPFDVEPYGPRDSEYAAAQRLLRRAVQHLGPRFADYVVGDGAYATAPFLHTAGEVGLPVVARLKENHPLLAAAVRARFDGRPPQAIFQEGKDRVEVWIPSNSETAGPSARALHSEVFSVYSVRRRLKADQSFRFCYRTDRGHGGDTRQPEPLFVF